MPKLADILARPGRRLALSPQARRPALTIICTGLILGVLIAPLVGLRAIFQTDFFTFLIAAHVARMDPASLYSRAAQHAVSQTITGDAADQVDFYINPPIGAFVLRPLTAISPQAGFGIFAVVSWTALGLSALIIWRWGLPGQLSRAPGPPL